MDSKEAALRLLCHALPRKARNDGVGALYEKVDSKILEIESWLCVCFGVESLAVGFG